MTAHDVRLRDPRTLTSLPEILSCLSAYQSEEADLSSSLSDLLSARDPIINSLARLTTLVPLIDDLHGEAALLANKVSQTAQTAERVGGRVRSLDEEMKRIREASDRVGQVVELKSSLSALQASIEAQDWDSATRHCARAMTLPPEVIGGPFAEQAVPTSESHLPPAQTLQEAREHLLRVFRQQFKQASESRDSAVTSRFFKLFPAIGWEVEGLEVYAAFVVDLVRVRPPASAKTSSPMYYITALTALYESVAMIVDQHQPVVEKYYGAGKMIPVVEKLLDECDRVTKMLLDGWEEERRVKRHLNDVATHPLSSANGRRTMAQPEQDDVDPREIDKLLTEIASMSSRWHLFCKFLRQTLDDASDSDSGKEGDTNIHTDAEAVRCIQKSGSNKLFMGLLSTCYMPMEVWYLRSVVEKAHRLSSRDLSQGPTSTTTPDDVFYVLKVVLSRLLSTGSLATVEKATNQLRDVMEQDYAGGIKKKLDDVYRPSASSGNRGERVEAENRISFIIFLNDLDISTSHVERLIKGIQDSPIVAQHFVGENQPLVKSYLSSFASVGSKFTSILRLGVEQLFNQLIRPKLRTFLVDIYRDVSYVLDDNSYATAEYQDIVRKKFIKSWEGFMEAYKESFTEHNYRMFFGLMLDVLLRPWEKLITGLQFNELGAIRFDRDLRSITTYLASQTAFGDAREKFVRLQQISTLLNLDSDEDVDEFYNGSGITWKLSAQEARAVVALKV